MKLLTTLLLSAVAFAQTPVTQEPKPTPVPTPVKVEPVPVKQEPKPAPAPTPAPGTQDPKPNQGKPATDKPVGDKPVGDKPVEEPRIDRPDKDQPMPKGTDPADIAAMKSAEDMLKAEKRLADEIKAGKFTGLDKILPFDELDSWPYEDGLKGMPKRVKDLSGKKVLMTGFMLPIDEVQNIKEFLLVKSLWSCCYGQPPDIHGIIRVVMPKGKTTDYLFDPLKIVGTFKVEATVMEGYCVDIYQLHVESLEALRFKSVRWWDRCPSMAWGSRSGGLRSHRGRCR
jgi:hypothetical protein